MLVATPQVSLMWEPTSGGICLTADPTDFKSTYSGADVVVRNILSFLNYLFMLIVGMIPCFFSTRLLRL